MHAKQELSDHMSPYRWCTPVMYASGMKKPQQRGQDSKEQSPTDGDDSKEQSPTDGEDIKEQSPTDGEENAKGRQTGADSERVGHEDGKKMTVVHGNSAHG